MKKTMTQWMTAFLMLLSLQTMASNKGNPLKNFNASQILTSYVASTTQGKTELNKYLLTSDFTYKNNRDEKTYSKREYSAFVEASKGLTYDCTTSYQVTEQYGDLYRAKITMTFDNFTRVDYVTLIQVKDSWRVSQVVTTYP